MPEDVDLDELERLALAATPGPWRSWVEGRDGTGGDSFVQAKGEGTPDLYPRLAVGDHQHNANWVADQDYIAAANPAVVLNLIRQVRASKTGE
jgi:hypothetical protein